MHCYEKCHFHEGTHEELCEAEQQGGQDIFTVYVLERTLYRISISDYKDKFTLKDGILLYGLFTEDFTWATTDIDLLGAKISYEAENMKAVFAEIFRQECDDPIVFKPDALKVSNITEFKVEI